LIAKISGHFADFHYSFLFAVNHLIFLTYQDVTTFFQIHYLIEKKEKKN